METIELASKNKNAKSQSATIPWSEWIGASVTEEYLDNYNATKKIQHSLMWTHRIAHGFNLVTDKPIETDKTDRPYPVCMHKEESGSIKVLAEADISQGHLAMPLFCRKDSSFVIPRKDKQVYLAQIELIGKVK